MNKKIALIISGISLVLVTLVLVFYLQFKTKFSAVSPVSQITPTPTVEEMSIWTDPAQFSFQYPRALALNPHNEDQTNYAHVELTSATHSGNLIVWVKDTTSDTIDNWILKEKIKNAIDSELASVSAKKVLTTNENNNITLSTIRNGYLYQIEVNPTNNDFWNKIFNQVTSTFKFVSSGVDVKQQTGSGGPNEQGLDEGTTEADEVIE